MKKVILLILIIFITGCSVKSVKDLEYFSLINELQDQKEFSTDLPFDYNINITRENDSNLRYELILDNPKENLNNIKCLIIHNLKTNDIYPSIGIYDDTVNLESNNSKVKGIILIGYIPYSKEKFNGNFRIYVNYEINNKVEYKYIEKNISTIIPIE